MSKRESIGLRLKKTLSGEEIFEDFLTLNYLIDFYFPKYKLAVLVVKKSDYNAKISEIEGKIPSISNLATTSALTTVENKIPSVSNLVKKTNYNTKITKIEKNLLIINMTIILQLQNLIN